jgi:hypothetical protein
MKRGTSWREAVARIIEPNAFRFLDSHAPYVVPETVAFHRERQAAFAKADAIAAIPQTPGTTSLSPHHGGTP